jgi:SAM-dependent methyltransferase
MRASASPSEYWNDAAARRLLGAERTWLMHQAGSIAGEPTLLLTPGTPVDIPWHSMVMRTGAAELSGCVRAESAALPFLDDCWPRVVLQHALDVRGDPLQLMREASRILTPGGEMLLFGFNPWSPWTWRQWTGQSSFRRCVRPHLPGRLCALAERLGLVTIELRGFGPKLGGEIDRVGQGGGSARALYVLRTRKHSSQAIALRGRRGVEVGVPAGLAPSATRNLGSAA